MRIIFNKGFCGFPSGIKVNIIYPSTELSKTKNVIVLFTLEITPVDVATPKRLSLFLLLFTLEITPK